MSTWFRNISAQIGLLFHQLFLLHSTTQSIKCAWHKSTGLLKPGYLKHLSEMLCKLINSIAFCKEFLSQVVTIFVINSLWAQLPWGRVRRCEHESIPCLPFLPVSDQESCFCSLDSYFKNIARMYIPGRYNKFFCFSSLLLTILLKQPVFSQFFHLYNCRGRKKTLC